MIKVACIGDSITSGFTLLNPRRDSYPSLLQKMLGDSYEVRDFGVLDAAARFDADTPYVRKKAYTKSLDWNPDIVLIMLGSNDTKRRNWDPEIFRRDYRKIVSSYMGLPSCPRVSDCSYSDIPCLGYSADGTIPGNDGRWCTSGNSRDYG